jgi:hypothetical protein
MEFENLSFCERDHENNIRPGAVKV